MIPPRFQPLTTGRAGRAAREASIQFLLGIWSYHAPEATTFIATKDGDRWRDHPIKGNREAAIADIFAKCPADRNDVYFSPNAFSEPRRIRAYALPTRLAWCDIDLADPAGYDPAPNILWKTSPLRSQGLWIWDDVAIGAVAERYSRAIVLKDGGDRGGWSVTKTLRVPGSINHKPAYDRPVVTLLRYDDRPQGVQASLKAMVKRPNVRPTSSPLPASGDDASTMMRRYRRQMDLPGGALMTAKRVVHNDKSVAVFRIVRALIDAGAPDADIATILVANPYFIGKWGTDRERAVREAETIRARLEGGR